MNENNEDLTKNKKDVKASTSSSSLSDNNTNDLTKRKKDLKEEGELIDVGVRVIRGTKLTSMISIRHIMYAM